MSLVYKARSFWKQLKFDTNIAILEEEKYIINRMKELNNSNVREITSYQLPTISLVSKLRSVPKHDQLMPKIIP